MVCLIRNEEDEAIWERDYIQCASDECELHRFRALNICRCMDHVMRVMNKLVRGASFDQSERREDKTFVRFSKERDINLPDVHLFTHTGIGRL